MPLQHQGQRFRLRGTPDLGFHASPGQGAGQGQDGQTAIAGDPDGAMVQADPGGGGSGELVYVRGKVKTRVFWHGGNLADADGLQRLLKLRRVP